MSSSIFKSDDEIEKLLSHPNNAIKVAHKIIGAGNHGIKSGPHLLPPIDVFEDKVDASVLANLIGPKAAAELLNANPTTVSGLKNGRTADREFNQDLIEQRDSRLGKLSEKALSRVDILLDIISDDKIEALAPVVAATTAEKMVNIYDKLRKKDPRELVNDRPSVVFYSPRQVTVNDYRIQEVD